MFHDGFGMGFRLSFPACPFPVSRFAPSPTGVIPVVVIVLEERWRWRIHRLTPQTLPEILHRFRSLGGRGGGISLATGQAAGCIQAGPDTFFPDHLCPGNSTAGSQDLVNHHLCLLRAFNPGFAEITLNLPGCFPNFCFCLPDFWNSDYLPARGRRPCFRAVTTFAFRTGNAVRIGTAGVACISRWHCGGI